MSRELGKKYGGEAGSASSDEEIQVAAAPAAPADDSAYSSVESSGPSGSSSEGSTGDKSKTPSPVVAADEFEFNDIFQAVDNGDKDAFSRLIRHPSCYLDTAIDMGGDRDNSLYEFLGERCDAAAFDAFFEKMLAAYCENLDKHLAVIGGVLDRNSRDIVWRLFETSSVVALDELCQKVNGLNKISQDAFYGYLGTCISNILQGGIKDNANSFLKDVLKFLNKDWLKNLRDDRGRDLIFACVTHGNLEVLRFLVEKGCCDFDRRYERGYGIMHLACVKQNKGILSYLSGVKPELLNQTIAIGGVNLNLLRFAFFANKDDSYDVLFDMTPEDSRLTFTGNEAVRLALSRGAFNVAKKFFEKDPERLFDKFADGFTPLKNIILADVYGNDPGIDFRNYVIEKTCDYLRSMDDGERRVKIELMKDSNGRSQLFDAVDVFDVPCFRELISSGFSCVDVDSYGRTLFDYVCRKYESVTEPEYLREVENILIMMDNAREITSEESIRESRPLVGEVTNVSKIVKSRMFEEWKDPEMSKCHPRSLRGSGNIALKVVNRARGISRPLVYPDKPAVDVVVEGGAVAADQFAPRPIGRRHSASF